MNFQSMANGPIGRLGQRVQRPVPMEPKLAREPASHPNMAARIVRGKRGKNRPATLDLAHVSARVSHMRDPQLIPDLVH